MKLKQFKICLSVEIYERENGGMKQDLSILVTTSLKI